jgi:integrase
MSVKSIGENLVLRNGVAYARWRYGGRVRWQRAPVQGEAVRRKAGAWRIGEDGEAVATQQLVDWLQSWQNDIRSGKWEQAHAASARSEYPSVGRLMEVYERIAASHYAQHGAPQPTTARDCAGKFRIIAEGCGAGLEASTAELTPARVGRWIEGRVSAAVEAERPRARYSAWRTVAQARALWAGWTAAEYKEARVVLPECLGEWPRPARNAARPPAKTRPTQELIRGTLEAWRRLEGEDPALWLAATVLFYFGVRPGDALALTWGDIVEESGQAVLRVTPRKTSMSAAADRTQAHYLPAGLLARMRAANPAAGFIVPGSNPTERMNLYKRRLNAWMRAVGWDREHFRKGAYNFRSLYNSLVAHYHGAQVAAELIGDNVETAKRFYTHPVGSARVVIDPAEMIDSLPRQ